MENAYNETKFILKKYNISANKSLGQNFLIDDEIINKIIESSNIEKTDLVIEIGPGLGTLTSKLLEKAGQVIAIELDKKMVDILNDRFSLYDNFKLINEDVLKVDLKQIIDNSSFDKIKVVANLPYYITTPIIMKLLEDRLNLDSITVMVQKEVAERLCEEPGGKLSGAITYSVNYYCIPSKVIVVPNSSFIPEPNVESEVIKLTLRDKPPIDVKNEELLFKFIKTSFMQRRKTLINGLSNNGLINKDDCLLLLERVGLDKNIRGENLTLQDFANLVNEYILLFKNV